MFAKKESNQSGSVTFLVLAVVVLATLLFGTVYYLRQRGENIRQEQALEQYEKNNKAEKSEKENNESKTVVSEITVAPTVADNSSILPTTGPESTTIKVLGIFMLIVFLTAYVESRREVSYSL